MNGSVGRPVRRGDVTVTVLGVEKADDQVTVEVEVAPVHPPLPGPEPWDPSRPPDFVKFRANQMVNRLELRDAEGRPLTLSWNQGRGRNMTTIEHRVRLTPTEVFEDQPPDAAGPRVARKPVPVELRLHGFVQATVPISFDFRDVPLP